LFSGDSIWVPFTEAAGVQEKHPQHDPLLAQAAEYEVSAQQWGDLSENGRGFSLLNAEKCGYDTVEKGTLRLTLLRSPTYPDSRADQGPHDFVYSMYPHAGGWREAGTELQGYELNCPVLAVAAGVHEGKLPAAHSFVAIRPSNVILTAIKKAEDNNSLIFRFYEFEGKDCQVRLTLPEAATAAAETNLMEKAERSLSLTPEGREIHIDIGHHEIKTVKISFPNAAGSTLPRRAQKAVRSSKKMSLRVMMFSFRCAPRESCGYAQICSRLEVRQCSCMFRRTGEPGSGQIMLSNLDTAIRRATSPAAAAQRRQTLPLLKASRYIDSPPVPSPALCPPAAATM
jgi:hypothetical protein